MNTDAIDIYKDRAKAFREAQTQLMRRQSFLSILRLVFFVIFAWFVYSAFSARFEGYHLLYAFIAIIALLIAIIFAGTLKKKIRFLEQLILINENEIKVANGVPSFLDNGAAYIPANGFGIDLNVFGNHSLFHLLNRTGSQPGKKQLSERLANLFVNARDIENYQACVKELSGKIHFRQTLLAHALLLEEKEALVQLQSGIPVSSFAVLKNPFWSAWSVIWPALGVISIAYGAYKNNYASSLAVMLVGLLFLATILKKINLLYYHISKRSYLYTQYARCFQLISLEKFEHPYLVQKQQEIMDASHAFARLSRLTGLFDLRLSILSLFINGLFLFDLLCSRAYLRWNKQYQPFIKPWFDTLGEIELLNSLATFHYNHPSFVFPQPVSEKLLIKGEGVGHPLMKEKTAVVNDVEIGEPSKLHLVTGSNMSGKSTFLRTLGLNIVLAQIGAPVFAKTFLFHPVRLLTSFHHIDSLEESTSYFYAELKSLQRIIQSLSEPVPALVLLDEVMRGTNSKDKHDGTALLIKKMLSYPCLAMIATHDTELGILSETYPGAVENFCFESELKGDELTFDFTMRKGVAQTKNATYLMKQMGIL